MSNLNCNFSGGSIRNAHTMLRLLSNRKKGLKIIHLNAQSLVNKIDEFRYMFEKSDIDVLCVSETWFSDNMPDSLFKIEGYKIFRADRLKQNVKRSGGVAIFVKNKIPCKFVEYLFIEIHSTDSKMLIGSIYRPHRSIDCLPILNVIQDISFVYDNVVICGDFNSNALCDDSLISEMLSLGLYSCNLFMPTHFSKFSNSLLDMFFVSNLSNKLLYDQLSCSAFSKHDLIYLCYNFTIKLSNSSSSFSYRDFKSINYPSLSCALESITWNTIYQLESVDSQVSFLQSNVLKCFNEHVRLKTKTSKNNSRPWFNTQIKNLINDRNDAYNRWKKFKTVELHNNFRFLRNKTTLEIRKCKIKFYKDKFTNIIDSKKKWNAIKEMGICNKNQENNTSAINIDDLNEKFINIPMPIVTNDYYNNIFINSQSVIRNSVIPNDSILNSTSSSFSHVFGFICVNQEDIVKHILKIKSSAIGCDEIHPVFIKAILPKLLPYITYIFNTILTFSVYPIQWKEAKILPLPKTSGEYRPIAILPFLSKVFESVSMIFS